MTGKENYQWFGYDAICTNDQTIVIGVPGRRPVITEESAGAVYGFNIKDKSLKFALESNED